MSEQSSINLCLDECCKRDSQNARDAKTAAEIEMKNFNPPQMEIDFTSGIQKGAHLIDFNQSRYSTLRCILTTPFHAMVEVVTETENARGDLSEQTAIWYANTNTKVTEILENTGKRIIILPWTHPGIQIALSEKLGIFHDIDSTRYRLTGVKPLARAKFTQVLPSLIGLYDPGGRTESYPERAALITGLRAVKLDMTPEQVNAFIGRMDGMMLVTGAPGSGKTTVALQRIRFLFNQQLEIQGLNVAYSEKATRVFLANENLIPYTRNLLVEELEIPASVVEYVPQFMTDYLDYTWQYKHRARPRMRQIHPLEVRARKAFWGLCTSKDLKGVWKVFEHQVASRLSQTNQTTWVFKEKLTNKVSEDYLGALIGDTLSASNFNEGDDPIKSQARMGFLYSKVNKSYERLRESLSQSKKDYFDTKFQQWLYWVFDPIDALESYFKNKLYDGQIRIRQGTAARLNDEDVVAAIKKDLNDRQYGPEMEPWICWLLRFALPEEHEALSRFRQIPCAYPAETDIPEGKWTHVVIDEAQDLSVPEASLLASLVHPYGALTISADFRQVVSPVQGMTDPSAFQIGNKFQERNAFERFPFAKNMRQSQQIGRFLENFYQAMFGEVAPFETGKRFSDIKPQLLIGSASDFPLQIKRIVSVFRRSKDVATIALLQINEDETLLNRMRAALEKENVELAPIWDSAADKPLLITTSVERIKGLEYDACIVLGLDDTEKAVLKFTKNRAYVALSRACRRLVMLCEEFPMALQAIRRDLFDVIQMN